MSIKSNWRERAKRGVESYFEERSFPRFILGLNLLLTALAGFGLSLGLLHLGIDSMGWRYPLAVVGSYGVFLLLMRIWVEFERRRFDPAHLVIEESEAHTFTPSLTPTETKRSWLDYLDVPDLDPAGCLPTILLGVVIGLIVLLFTALASAPILLAEVFVDAFLAGVLYRHLRIAADEHWLGTAIRRTWLYVLATAILLGIGGLCLTIMAPGSRTIGDAIEHFSNPKSER